ncbi:sel1 repeat family protein [Oxalobacter aliiformigenes]|nr:tetratricopeptide repeat protein [Oxalobacter aliiformigenes]WAW00246.1 sel1 repeat family protein [Oxalobacter aliiformigenes]
MFPIPEIMPFFRFRPASLLSVPFLATILLSGTPAVSTRAAVARPHAIFLSKDNLPDLLYAGTIRKREPEKAEQKNYPLPDTFTGMPDLSGPTGKKDWRAARLRYEKAAENGDLSAQYFLGLMYLTGKGALKNPEKAFDWFLQAARRKLPEAQYWLADCYAHGRGTVKSDREAMYWYRIAARNGHIEAQTVTGLALLYGVGLQKDEKEATVWLEKSGQCRQCAGTVLSVQTIPERHRPPGKSRYRHAMARAFRPRRLAGREKAAGPDPS